MVGRMGDVDTQQIKWKLLYSNGYYIGGYNGILENEMETTLL